MKGCNSGRGKGKTVPGCVCVDMECSAVAAAAQFREEKIASFCMITDFGIHQFNGREVKIGGPGCVGTIPEYRNKGIGLTMVKQVTQILKEEEYGYSYIHYTSEVSWYEKLGYKTSIRWNGKGIL